MYLDQNSAIKIESGLATLGGIISAPCKEPVFACLFKPETNSTWNIPTSRNDNQVMARRKLRLPTIDADMIRCAKFLAKSIHQEWKKDTAFYQRTRAVHGKTLLQYAAENRSAAVYVAT